MNESLDREINLRVIVGFAVGLVVITVISAVFVWYFSLFLRDYRASQDPPAPALAAAREPYEPPGPRLQVDPEQEMEALREHERSVLESYGWIDEAAGIARIPIERAITLAVGDDGPPKSQPQEPEEATH